MAATAEGHVRETLMALYEAAIAAAHPERCLPPHLPSVPKAGRLFVVGAGKAAAAMALVTEAHYRGLGSLDRVSGFATAPYATVSALPAAPAVIEVIGARHPIPDQNSVAAAERALKTVGAASERDLVVVLLSGGASALWAAPVAGLDLAAKTALTRGLLKSGADIHEMNTVRRHLSRIKGGRLRKATPAPMLTLAISDVPGDDPATIGSGPTVADPSTLGDARCVLLRRQPTMAALGISIPASVEAALANRANETPKPEDLAFSSAEYHVIATPAAALEQAALVARQAGYQVLSLGDAVTGEAREAAQQHAELARAAKEAGRRVAIISGGELSVTVLNARGRGGRSQEYALALAVALAGLPGVSALVADTDGIDGGEGKASDPAGAWVEPATLSRARHLDAQAFLDNNDARSFFEATDGLIVRGPTHTNVNDFRVILVDP
jgi:glycerate 2-kinase